MVLLWTARRPLCVDVLCVVSQFGIQILWFQFVFDQLCLIEIQFNVHGVESLCEGFRVSLIKLVRTCFIKHVVSSPCVA